MPNEADKMPQQELKTSCKVIDNQVQSEIDEVKTLSELVTHHVMVQSDIVNPTTTSHIVSSYISENTFENLTEHVQYENINITNASHHVIEHVTEQSKIVDLKATSHLVSEHVSENSGDEISTRCRDLPSERWHLQETSPDAISFLGDSTEMLNILEDSKLEGGHAHNHKLSEAGLAASCRPKKIKGGKLHTAFDDTEMPSILADALKSPEAQAEIENLNNDPNRTLANIHVPRTSLSDRCQEYVATTFDPQGRPAGKAQIAGVFIRVKDKDKDTTNPPILITAYPKLEEKSSIDELEDKPSTDELQNKPRVDEIEDKPSMDELDEPKTQRRRRKSSGKKGNSKKEVKLV